MFCFFYFDFSPVIFYWKPCRVYLIRSGADSSGKTDARLEDESDGRSFLFWTGTHFICFFSVFPVQKRESE